MKKKAKRITSGTAALLMAFVMVITMSAAVFAGTVTRDQALKTALKNAKLSSSEVKRVEAELEDDENSYEIEFIKKSNKAEYSYEISASDGRILEKSVDYSVGRNTSKKTIGRTAAIKKVARFSGIRRSLIKKGSCRLVRDDGQRVYKVRFSHKGRRYEYEVLAPTGRILEYEWEVIRR